MMILTAVSLAMQMAAVVLDWINCLTNWRLTLTTFLNGFMKVT